MGKEYESGESKKREKYRKAKEGAEKIVWKSS